MTLTTASQMRGARATLGWKQSELAERSGVSLPSVKRLESLEGKLGAHDATIGKLRDALESAGVEFIPENGGGPGVRLKGP